ncbi:MAG: PilZ domain-containing protein [Planctomycetes bacterium]|nr:PilZ domain-containing protein [Planctomycetota bacterium]
MTTTKATTQAQCEQALTDALRRRDRAVVTLHHEDGWRTHKATFLFGSRPAGRIGLRLAVTAQDNMTDLPQPGETLGVTFRAGHKKCMFASTMQSAQWDDGTADRPAGILVTVLWPDHLQQLQRRAYERAAPPSGTIIPVRFWRENQESNSTGGRAGMRHGQLEDLSAGGMCIVTTDVAEGELERYYRCVFTPKPGGPAVIIDARLRYRETADQGRVRLGFHFVGLETTAEGRRLLTRIARIVARFQRTRSRQHRDR